jgi:hypothetical protein
MILRMATTGALAACALLCFDPSASAQERAATRAAQTQAGEWSATKKPRHVRHYQRPAYAYRVPRYLGPDPAFDPSGRLYQRPTWGGSCVIDDGYGRFSACSNR